MKRVLHIPAYRAFFFAAVLLCVPLHLFSISAVVEEIKGKVELKAPGGSWQSAERGMELGKGTTISTGFNSEAEIAIGGSILKVSALTRMDLEELIEREGTIDTSLNLKVGKVKADVRSTEGMRNNFRVRSPQSTAAVRGTIFEYDGYTLTVEQGSVALSNNLGQIRAVSGGERSKTDGFSLPSSGEEGFSAEFDVDLSSADEEDVAELAREQFPEYATLILRLLEYWE